MKLSYEDHGPTSVITISGELTADQADAFRRICAERFANTVRNIVLDLEYLELVDSAGLELLLWLVDELNDRFGQLRLVRVNETVRKILEITRLERRFDIHDTIEAAARTLR